MGDLYAAIRNQHIQDYGSKFEEWAPRILVDQYSDRTHFIFELIQNAEDAGATYVTFSLYQNRLVLCHNGKQFTEADIRGICGIRSTKDEPESGKIGRFGIGFKSVYAYTRTPVIYSGQYSFRIQNLILPYAEKNESAGIDTILILPFDGKVPAEDAYGEIRRALEKYISSDVLFALKNVRSINCRVDPAGEEWSVNKESHPISSIVDRVLLLQKGKETKELLTFHTQDRQPILIGYELKQGENGHGKIVPAEQHYLYVYFPTAVETHQAFYVHVPFSTTPARDNIRHNAINENLSEQLNQLFADSIRWLLKNSYITLQFLNEVYPIENNCKEENLQGIYRTGRELLQNGLRLLPTDAGEYCSVSEALLPYAKNIAENITQPILRSEYGENACWIESEISSEANARLWGYLTHCFGIRVLRWKDVLPKLKAEILEEQTDEWLLHLMEVIYPTCTGNLKLKDKVDAHEIPFVRLQDGTHIYCRYDGVAQVYINNPISAKNKISTKILQDKRGYNFYTAALGIEEYNAVQELKDDVVCFYGEDSEDTDIPFEDNLEHFALIERAIKENQYEVQRILAAVPIVWTKFGWKKPTECYICPDMLEKGEKDKRAVMAMLDLPWVSEDYRGKVPTEVFLKIGCNIDLKIVDVDQKTYLDLLGSIDFRLYSELQKKVFSKRYTKVDFPEEWNWNCTLDHIDDILQCKTLQQSIGVARYLNDIVKKHPLYGRLLGSQGRAFNTATAEGVDKVPSMLALQLHASAWLYDKNGDAQKASELKKSMLSPEYGRCCSELLEQLSFETENEAVEAAIQSVDTPYQDFVGTMLKKPDELRWMFETYQKFQRKKKKEELAPESLMGLLKKQSSAQTEIESELTPDEEELGEYGAVRNLKHREKKLDESFQEGLEGQKAVTPRLHYTCSESNQAEKAFLRAQYFGKCQICGKQILQASGKVYFEACNILPTDAILDRYRHSISEGWNSLCLCPNCTAEFKYGKKNLSELISMIQNYHVEEQDENLIVCTIEMQGEKRTIKYTGKHFLALQRAIKIYEQDSTNEQD